MERLQEGLRITSDEFNRRRREIIGRHPNSEALDLEDGVRFHRTHFPERNVPRAFDKASKQGQVLVQPLVGRTTINQQQQALKAVQDAGADILSTQVDSFTRAQKWDEIGAALREARDTGDSTLNGFPIVNHAVEDVRTLVETCDLPMELRAYGPDLRLVAETGFAAGYSALTGNPLYIAANYTSNLPLESVYRNWQYIYRLVGEYELRGVPILTEIKPLAAGVPLPPAINVASIVLDILVAFTQGVRNIGWVNRPQGNFEQAAAVARSIQSIANRYIPDDEVKLYQLGSHWNGVWSEATEENYTIMTLNAVEVILAGAIELYVKTSAEGKSLPRVAETVASVRSTKTVIEVLGKQVYPVDERVREEAERIETTAIAIVDAALEAGGGDPIKGSLVAIREGLIDVPYPTSDEFSGSIRVARDQHNAVRFSEVGAVPVPEKIQSFHTDRLDKDPSEATGREQMLEAMYLFR